MTEVLFNRKAKVIVTDPDTKQSVEFDKNRIFFEIQKSIDSLPNVATISIYNADPDFSDFVNKENLKIDLLVSYFEDEEEILFTGDVKRIYPSNVGEDNILIIDAGDSEETLQTSFINKSYKAGVIKKQIVQDCINFLRVDILTTTLSRITGSYNGGFVSFGKVIDTLDIIIEGLGLEYSIQNNQFIITEKGEVNNNDFIEIDYDRGLILKPIPLQNGGVLLNCLLNSKYSPHNTIFLNIGSLEGFYQIRQIDFVGDNEQGKWEANLICE